MWVHGPAPSLSRDTLGKLLLCAFLLLCKMGIRLPHGVAVRIKGDNLLSTGSDICIKYFINVS